MQDACQWPKENVTDMFLPSYCLRKWTIRIGICKILYLLPFSIFHTTSRSRDLSIYLFIYLSSIYPSTYNGNLESVCLKSLP